jgi:1,4-dihydroxy-2-naphthoate octaprenyltransferase
LYGYYLQRGGLEAEIFLAAGLPSALQIAMLLAIEFPDAAGDAAVGKRTLVVRLGAPVAARLYAGLVIAGFGALPLFAHAGLPARVAAAPLVVAPFAVWQAIRVARGAYRDSARWESVAAWSVGLLIASAAAELAGAISLLGG